VSGSGRVVVSGRGTDSGNNGRGNGAHCLWLLLL